MRFGVNEEPEARQKRLLLYCLKTGLTRALRGSDYKDHHPVLSTVSLFENYLLFIIDDDAEAVVNTGNGQRLYPAV